MTDWRGLYRDGWGKEIVPEAFAHPAKFARGLIRHIYQHAIEERWLRYDDVVLDPFGGVALGSLDAMRHGLRWVGVELEQKFVDLGNQNIAKWMREYAPHFPGWGSAQLLQGNSRNLIAVIGEAAGVVSSPPYATTEITSRLDSGADIAARKAKRASGDWEGYNRENPSNLGNLRATASGLAAAISSPPYSSEQVHGRPSSKDDKIFKGRTIGTHGSTDYGSTPGQLGAMKASGFDAAVSSPPWTGSIASESNEEFYRARGKIGKITGTVDQEYAESRLELHNEHPYMSPEWLQKRKEMAYFQNLGKLPDEAQDPKYPTFWSEARKIVSQVYQVLAPGGVAIWVVKAFVKNGKRVDFPGQWRQMCEAAGFETLHQHRAWLVEQRGAQFDLNGDLVEKRVERKSFFRRLAEKKGSPRIDYEVALCQRKPLPLPAATGGGEAT